MTKLKTLKDFEEYKMPEIDKQIIKALKAEAVKWVKDLDNEDCPECKKMGGRTYGYCEDCKTAHVVLNVEDIKEWIKHFFNLTKDDLK